MYKCSVCCVLCVFSSQTHTIYWMINTLITALCWRSFSFLFIPLIWIYSSHYRGFNCLLSTSGYHHSSLLLLSSTIYRDDCVYRRIVCRYLFIKYTYYKVLQSFASKSTLLQTFGWSLYHALFYRHLSLLIIFLSVVLLAFIKFLIRPNKLEIY